jgi:hypothetical protein
MAICVVIAISVAIPVAIHIAEHLLYVSKDTNIVSIMKTHYTLYSFEGVA